MLIWRFSPFRPIEKLLLLLSYFLFWEYFVISRSYALMALVGFGFIALRATRPEQCFWPWVLLGLLANTTLFGAIWALGLGAAFAWRSRQEWRSMLGGGAVFAVLVVLAIATMIPAPDRSGLSMPSLQLSSLAIPLRFAVGAFFPFFPPFVADALNSIGGWGADLAATSLGAETLLGAASNKLLTLALLAVPVLVCFSIVRDRGLTATYAAIYIGVLLFGQLWSFLGSPRHYGILFIALVGTVWMWRSAILPARPVASVWIALLVINALGGLTTLAADLRPFSQSRNAAVWLQRHHFDDAFLIGSRDFAASPIAGYLRRPLYYLECECFGTYIEWSTRRKDSLHIEEVVARVARVMQAENKSEAYLILNSLDRLGGQKVAPDLAFAPVKRFPSAIVGDETYLIYRVSKRNGN